MYEIVVGGALAGVAAAGIWFGIQCIWHVYLAKRDLRKFGMMVETWIPGCFLDDERITDDMQYKITCESMIQLVSESHIEHLTKMYLLYVLREETMLADSKRVFGHYFMHLTDNNGKFRLPENGKYGRSGLGW